jgi:hypothetical protein
MFIDIIKFVSSNAELVGRSYINSREHARTHTQLYAKYCARVNSYFLDFHGVRHLQVCSTSVSDFVCMTRRRSIAVLLFMEVEFPFDGGGRHRNVLNVF